MSTPKTVFVLTTSRADFGIYSSVLAALDAHPQLTPKLIVTGMHMSGRHGVSMKTIEASDYPIAARFACLHDADAAVDIAHSMARATDGMATALGQSTPDILLTLGDRFEMLAAAMAAVPFSIPIAHIHGGEETEGAIDNVFRHMLTKMSQLHFAATPNAAARIRQMGEPDDRVHVSGAPALDSIKAVPRLSQSEMKTRFDLDVSQPYHMVTYHPVTLDPEASLAELKALLSVLSDRDEAIVFSGTNADTGGLAVQAEIDRFVARRPNALQVDSFGAQAYYTAMDNALTMIGNSSSGIIEAASAGLPVVNIGARQHGRERSANVVDTVGTDVGIRDALNQALALQGQTFENIYGRGDAGTHIAQGIAAFLINGASARKSFVDRSS